MTLPQVIWLSIVGGLLCGWLWEVQRLLRRIADRAPDEDGILDDTRAAVPMLFASLTGREDRMAWLRIAALSAMLVGVVWWLATRPGPAIPTV